MNPILIPAIIEIGRAILDKIPDPGERAKAEAAMLEKVADQDFQARLAQVEINKIEAASASWFVAGWRPAAGWVSVAGLAYTVALHPTIEWIGAQFGWAPPPDIDTEMVMALLFALLGLGTLRTVEKLRK